jgi:NAD(P)-dependent dehydrogenase (short-subunit alcohol dehydrogenase family)
LNVRISLGLEVGKSEENKMSKVWFVTGANSGIGLGVSKAALQAGDRVVATGRNMEKLRSAYADAGKERLALIELDVTDEARAHAAVAEAVERFGPIDVLVNNAGYSVLGSFEELVGSDALQAITPVVEEHLKTMKDNAWLSNSTDGVS